MARKVSNKHEKARLPALKGQKSGFSVEKSGILTEMLSNRLDDAFYR